MSRDICPYTNSLVHEKPEKKMKKVPVPFQLIEIVHVNSILHDNELKS